MGRVILKNVYDIRYENGLLFLLPEDGKVQLSYEIHSKTAILIYLYYIDTMNIYYRYIFNIPLDIDVYIISSSEEVLQKVRSHVSEVSKRQIYCILKENRGRDVSALIVTGKDIVTRYKYICFLHDKKEHSEEKKEDIYLWIENLWGNQIGSQDYIDNILNLFENHKDIGILAPPEPIGRYFSTWCGHGWYHSFEITRELAGKLQLATDLREDKPPITLGTVLWFRYDALKKLFDLGWKYSDFDDEKLCREDYLSYAVERIFAYVAQDAGYKTGTVMTISYAAKQMSFFQYATHCFFNEMDSYFPIDNLNDLEYYKRNKSKVVQFARKNTKVYLYGAGKMGSLCSNILRKENIELDGYLVSKSPETEMADGISVSHVDMIRDWQNVAVIITVYDKRVQDEIILILKAHGCHNYIKFWDWEE